MTVIGPNDNIKLPTHNLKDIDYFHRDNDGNIYLAGRQPYPQENRYSLISIQSYDSNGKLLNNKQINIAVFNHSTKIFTQDGFGYLLYMSAYQKHSGKFFILCLKNGKLKNLIKPEDYSGSSPAGIYKPSNGKVIGTAPDGTLAFGTKGENNKTYIIRIKDGKLLPEDKKFSFSLDADDKLTAPITLSSQDEIFVPSLNGFTRLSCHQEPHFEQIGYTSSVHRIDQDTLLWRSVDKYCLFKNGQKGEIVELPKNEREAYKGSQSSVFLRSSGTDKPGGYLHILQKDGKFEQLSKKRFTSIIQLQGFDRTTKSFLNGFVEELQSRNVAWDLNLFLKLCSNLKDSVHSPINKANKVGPAFYDFFKRHEPHILFSTDGASQPSLNAYQGLLQYLVEQETILSGYALALNFDNALMNEGIFAAVPGLDSPQVLLSDGQGNPLNPVQLSEKLAKTVEAVQMLSAIKERISPAFFTRSPYKAHFDNILHAIEKLSFDTHTRNLDIYPEILSLFADIHPATADLLAWLDGNGLQSTLKLAEEDKIQHFDLEDRLEELEKSLHIFGLMQKCLSNQVFMEKGYAQRLVQFEEALNTLRTLKTSLEEKERNAKRKHDAMSITLGQADTTESDTKRPKMD